MSRSGVSPAEIDHTRLDSEHEVQVGLLVALRAAVVRGGAVPARPVPAVPELGATFDAAAILDQLVDYTAVHFMAEQLLMRLHGYPGFEAHQIEHDRLIEEVQELQRRFQAGDMALTLETIDGLSAWLHGHIRGTDAALADFLQRQG